MGYREGWLDTSVTKGQGTEGGEGGGEGGGGSVPDPGEELIGSVFQNSKLAAR